MDDADRVPALDAEGNASQENLNNILDNQNATTNPFQSGMERTSEEIHSSNIEDAGSHVRFEETTSDKDVPKTSEEQCPPTQTQHYNNLRQSVLEREIQNLKSTNLPGLSELGPLRSTRNRGPSYQKAKSTFEDALKSLTRELMEFDDQHYYDESPESLPLTDIRSRYRKIHLRKQALMIATEDLSPLLEKSGLVQEERIIQKEVDAILIRITNIKLSFTDVVSRYTDSISPDHEIDSQTHTSTPNLTNTSPTIWSNGSSLQDVVLTTSICTPSYQPNDRSICKSTSKPSKPNHKY